MCRRRLHVVDDFVASKRYRRDGAREAFFMYSGNLGDIIESITSPDCHIISYLYLVSHILGQGTRADSVVSGLSNLGAREDSLISASSILGTRADSVISASSTLGTREDSVISFFGTLGIREDSSHFRIGYPRDSVLENGSNSRGNSPDNSDSDSDDL